MGYKPLTHEQKERRRKRERERIQRNTDFILSQYYGNYLSFEGKRYTVKQLAKKRKSFIDEVLSAQTEEIFITKKYLCVAWANYVDDFDFYSFLKTVGRTETTLLLKLIYQRYKEAKRNRLGGSPDMKGFYIAQEFSHKRNCFKWFKSVESRGYCYGISLRDKGVLVYNTQDSDVIRLCMSKEFTVKGLATLLFAVMSATKNLDAIRFYEEMFVWLSDDNPRLVRKLYPFEK